MEKEKIFYRQSQYCPAPDDDVSIVGGNPSSGVNRLFANQARPVSGTKYRYSKFYLKNSNDSGTADEDRFNNVIVWMFNPPWNYPSMSERKYKWALGTEYVPNQTTIQGTAPTGVTFIEQDATIMKGLIIGGVEHNAYSKGIWVRLTINTGEPPTGEIYYYIRWIGSGGLSSHDNTV